MPARNRLVQPAHGLELGRSQRDVAGRGLHRGPGVGETRRIREASEQDRARRSRRRHGDEPDPLGGHDGGPRVDDAQDVVAPPERDALAGRRAVLPAHGPHELPPRGRAAVDHRLLPGRDERAPHVADADHHQHPVPRECADQPACLSRRREAELLLRHHDGGAVMGRDQREQPVQRARRLPPVLAADALAEQVVGREPLGAVAAGEQHALGREPVGAGLEGALDGGRAGLREPHVEDDVCHGRDRRNRPAPVAWGWRPGWPGM